MRLPGQPADRREKISPKAQSYVLLGVIFAGLTLAFYLASAALFVLGGVVLLFWGFHFIFMTRVLMPTGESTPGDKPLSHIEAMVARGDYARAAEAYRAEIAADPEDFLSCERLAMLARSHLKAPEEAVSAFREAERRITVPRRKCGYALLALGVLRDDVKDAGRAMVEIRRILATYAEVPNAAALRAELEQLRASHFEGA